MSDPIPHHGDFIKHCPCSPQTVGCGYHNINLHTGCPYDCSYCILQLYLPSKASTFFSNRGDAARELTRLAQTSHCLRIGTGELADSLADYRVDDLIPFLYDLMAEHPGVILELKTKSARVQPILERPSPGNIVIAWSMNPHDIITREEPGTAPLEERLNALSAVVDKGYPVAVHFDPLIITPNWQALYREVTDQICERIPLNQLAWWSLGALRFPSGLRSHIFRHQDSRLFEGELIRGYDDKYRYLRPLREDLFRRVRSFIEARLGTVDPLYLCMEDEAMWRRVFPEHSPDPEAINRRLYRRVLETQPS
jgi:spore photoproduct lyase